MNDREAFSREQERRIQNPATFVKPEVFYHIACLPGWHAVVHEQLSWLSYVGLSEVNAFVLGTLEDAQKCVEIAGQYDVAFKLLGQDVRLDRHEEPTLSALYEWALSVGESACMYIHTKGLSNALDMHKRNWRHVMQYNVVCGWRQNLEYLKTYDIVGCNWQHSQEYPHFQGNFWMARSDWVCKLQHPRDYQAADRGPVFAGQGWNRMFAEAWIGSRPWHHMKSLVAEQEDWGWPGRDLEKHVPATQGMFRQVLEARAFREVEKLAGGDNPKVIALGSLGMGTPKGHPAVWPFPERYEVKGVDIAMGPSVQLVVDAHRLSDAGLGPEYDLVWSNATLEHLRYPLIAAAEQAKVLKLGGIALHITHQTFPIHGVPNDYWRFTLDALRTIYCAASGFEVLDACYDWRVSVASFPGGRPVPPGTGGVPAFIHCAVLARKVSEPCVEIEKLKRVLQLGA